MTIDYYKNKEIHLDCGVIFDIKHNVKSININVNNSCRNYDFYDEPITTTPYIFFIFETQYHLAFSHWVFESAIFLPYFKYFIDAQLLVNSNPKRDYKQLFFNLFNINNIQYLDNVEDEKIYQNIPKNNICIVSRNFTWNDLSSNSRDTSCLKLYKKLVMNFKDNIKYGSTEKYTEHLFLPRNVSQNYKPNDRIIDYTKIKKILLNKNYITYNTLETTDFYKQIQLVSTAKNIYLDWGSNMFVNGFFSKDSNIYCVNKMDDQYMFPFLKIILSLIEESNNMIYL